MILSQTDFYVTGGTLRHDAPSYVERRADTELFDGLIRGEFCYVLTSRQMGKSSLMVRTAKKLREQKVRVVTLDLTGIGQNLTPEQWYEGILARVGEQLRLEEELESYCRERMRLSPVQRFIGALQERALGSRTDRLVVFVDEIDVVRSLPFVTDEFFGAIRECYNRRTENQELNRLTFCLLGVAMPADLIRDPNRTPFNIGQRIELTDFTAREAAPLARCLGPVQESSGCLERILYWTNGHPYLTQRFCQTIAQCAGSGGGGRSLIGSVSGIDAICERLFLSPRAREQDDNLLFVRERILRTEADLGKLLELYVRIHKGEEVRDDETDDLINQLRLAGIVYVEDQRLRVRNRIYREVYDPSWVAAVLPDAELETPAGRLRIQRNCSIGRAPSCDLVLADPKVSRRHALVQVQKQYQFWLMDLGSSNGTYVNGQRVTQPVLLRNLDQIELGPFRLLFRQTQTGNLNEADPTNMDGTIFKSQ